MTFIPVMWVVWGVLVLIMIGLFLYRTNLTKDEEGQIFLDESFDHEKNAQEAIVARVNRLEPVIRTFKWVCILATLFVIGYYVRDFMIKLG
ncbi:MAG TPA: hypothetical protein VFU55_14470 [Terracidiphilus sp.]|nr:hypothetical protein [Terracidiphilus sp.]